MSVQSLTRNLPMLREPFAAPQTRDRPGRQTPPDEPPAAPRIEAQQDASPPLIKPDLSGLARFEPPTAGPSVDLPSNAHEFLNALSKLLASVGAGDVVAARNAATALQLELFGGSGALAASSESGQEAQTRMLDDLVALIRFARLGELGSAEASAQLLARDMQAALLAPARPRAPLERPPAGNRTAALSPPQPASLVQGATAAYELLMDLDATADAA